jgi:uroporphyrinogen decarboxylase
MTSPTSRFLRACAGLPTDATPVWLMRQAGRYMPEYRRLRERHSILSLIKDPELACEVTLQPIEAFDLDAAIIFSDILPPLEGMGLTLDFVKGEGPVLVPPVRSVRDIQDLRVPAPEEHLGFTLDAIRLARGVLDSRNIALIGFSGAPFTLACYAIEGGTSPHQRRAKRLMLEIPSAWHTLMEKLSHVVGHYLLAQARAGAQALQLFDSWVGALSPADYRRLVLPYSRRAIDIARAAGVPIIHFGTGTAGLLEAMHEAGGDVLGVDWRTDLDLAWRRVGESVPLQGNLDPVALLAPWPELKRRINAVLADAGGRARHIFNLGHGILPETPVENVRRLVEHVHASTSAVGMRAPNAVVAGSGA